MAKGKNKAPPAQTSTNAPWAPQGEALQFGFDEARNIYDQGPAFAPFSGVSQGAIGSAESIYPQVGQQLGATIGGDYLAGGNPYLDDAVARSQRSAMSGINSTFGGAGRTGGGLHQQALATGMGDVAAGIYAPAYEAERGRQLGAVMGAGGAINQQLGTGSILEDKDMQQQLSDYDNLQRYMNMIGGSSYGSTTTGPQGEGRGALAGGIGGAMTGASLSGGNPYAAAAGGAAGLLGII